MIKTAITIGLIKNIVACEEHLENVSAEAIYCLPGIQ